MQVEHTLLERALEPVSLAHLPLPVANSECELFVGRASLEPDHQGVLLLTALFQIKLRSLGFVKKVRVENVELVPLNDLGRGVLGVKVHLIVLVPLVSLLDRVEKARLARHVCDFALSDKTRLVRIIVELVQLQDVAKLDLVSIEALFLNFVLDLQARIVVAKTIDDVESNAGVQSCLADLLSQGLLDSRLVGVWLCFLAYAGRCLLDLIGSVHHTLSVDPLHLKLESLLTGPGLDDTPI